MGGNCAPPVVHLRALLRLARRLRLRHLARGLGVYFGSREPVIKYTGEYEQIRKLQKELEEEQKKREEEKKREDEEKKKDDAPR